jgi:hypothetical protein
VSFVCTEQFSSGGKAGHRFGRYPDTRVEWYGLRSPFVGMVGQHLDFFLISFFPFQSRNFSYTSLKGDIYLNLVIYSRFR